MKKLLVFAGWAISGFFLVIALVSLFSGFTKLTLGIIVWGLTFFPPLWKKTMTIEYGVIANIAMRIVAAIVAPFVGYLITPGDVPEKAQVAVISKQPVKAIEKATPEPEPAKIVAAKPEEPRDEVVKKPKIEVQPRREVVKEPEIEVQPRREVAYKNPELAARKVIDMESFLQIKEGMTYDQVVEILGKEGEKIFTSGDGTNEYLTYSWDASSGGGITATFENQELTTKFHFNLN